MENINVRNYISKWSSLCQSLSFSRKLIRKSFSLTSCKYSPYSMYKVFFIHFRKLSYEGKVRKSKNFYFLVDDNNRILFLSSQKV